MKGRISERDIDAIRERSNIIEVVSDYVSLKKKGKLFWGVCPFHKEKTPSFKVDSASQLFHCFGCGEGGNVFTFVMKMEHLEFPEAVETLAERIGYTIEREAENSFETSRKSKLLEANRLAAHYYQYILMKTSQGERGRTYLKKRELGSEIAKRYSLGLAPGTWSSLSNYLAKKGFSRDILIEVGLIVKGQKGYYDRFRDRLMFPIADARGRVIAFGGRIIDSGEPKYLNSPETPLYHKSSTLYGLNIAKNAIVREGSVLVVEGYTDVLSLVQAGVENVVATLGTAFTAEHFELLRRFADRVVLVFDADAAGIKAAESAKTYLSEFRPPRMEALQDLERKNPIGLDVRVVVLPGGQDPADFILAHGVDDFRGIIDVAEPFFDFYLTREIDRYNISEIRQKEQAALAGLRFIATLDPLSRGPYLGKIADKLGIDTDALEIRFKSVLGKRDPVKREAKASALSPQEKAERSFLHLLLKYPYLRTKIPADISEDCFAYPAHARLFTVLKDMGGGKFDASILDSLDGSLKTSATELFMADVDCEEENLSKYFEEYSIYLKDFYCKRQINKLKQELQGSRAHADHQYYDALFEELIALESRRRSLREDGTVG